MNKSPFIAFLLSFFPGGGLLYLGRVLRGLFYTFTVFGTPIFFLILAFISNWEEIFLIFALGGVLLYFINIIDTVLTASKLYENDANSNMTNESERFFTIILSFIPGLGHFQLGLTYRGTTLLIAFFGAIIMVFFVTLLTGREEFLVFLAALPIIWIFGFFDALKQLEKKQKGEPLEDISILEDLESRNTEGKKSKAIATLLSFFPGLGHLYLGLQRRGIQLMAFFLFSIYILDVLRLGLFLFIIPIIWFYSFFDGLQKASKADQNLDLEDKPIISSLAIHQKWLGIGLILLGLYFIFINIVLPIAEPYLAKIFKLSIPYLVREYIQTAIICLILIGGGIKLLLGKKQPLEEEGDVK